MIWLRRWPYFVPLVYFILICLIQPADRWVPYIHIQGYPLQTGFTRVIYDDADVAAYALRAENAARGRTAGKTEALFVERVGAKGETLEYIALRADQIGPTFNRDGIQYLCLRGGLPAGQLVKVGPDIVPATTVKITNDLFVAVPMAAIQRSIEPLQYSREKYARLLAADQPLTPHYFLEYPPAALYLFRLGQIGSGRPTGPISAAILDGHQVNSLFHAPRTDVEKQLWRSWRHAQRVYAFLLLAALVGLMALVSNGVGRDGVAAGPAWLFVLPGMLYFTPCRFDILPAALVVVAIALTDRKRTLLGAATLGLAVALKTYPLILAPLLLRYAVGSWRTAILWCLAFAAPVVGFAGSLALTDGIDAVLEPLKFQMNRPAEWLALYGRLFPNWLASDIGLAKALRSGFVLICVLCMIVRRPPTIESLLRRSAIAVLIFTATQVFYSPQWWIWIAVLLIPLVRTHRWLLLLVVASDLLTHALFPWFYDMNLNGLFQNDPGTVELFTDLLIYWRAGLWFGILCVLAAPELGGKEHSHKAEPSAAT